MNGRCTAYGQEGLAAPFANHWASSHFTCRIFGTRSGSNCSDENDGDS